MLAVLGPSGCGKTTTLRLIAGFEQPSAGEIRVGDRDVTRLPAHKRKIGFVFQSYALFPHLTVYDNVAYGLRARHAGEQEVRRSVGEALDLVGLAALAPRHPAALSGGQQQRVALARALAFRPAVLLLDEPLSNLDAKLRKDMREEVRRIQLEIGTSTVFVTHDQEEALSISDEIAVMNDGRIEQVGDPVSVYKSPQTAFVADFVGHAVLLPGTVSWVRDGLCEVVVDELGPVRSRAADRLGAGERVLVTVKEESLHIGEPDGQANGLPAAVETATFTGASIRYACRLKDGRALHLLTGSDGQRRQPGDEVFVRWEPAAASAIPAGQGRRA
ncbi:MAG: ATP-binding cassette domain-containing protein [Micromonosporaceae bacterium]|nr:ATP-binding cassette domain-containing protein [Micromonosporaceae bacterium]